MKNNLKIVSLFIVLIFQSLISISQNVSNGWELIKQNENKEARKTFESILKEDSLNYESIIGMLYLSELESDYVTYNNLSTRLVNEFKLPETYLLFDHVFEGDFNNLIIKSDSTKMAEVSLLYKKAQLAFTNRKFEESKNLYRKIIQDLNWSVIGPFSSISGSGFIKDFEVEKEAFKLTKLYNDASGISYNWVTKEDRPIDGIVKFSDNLNRNSDESVYYANTFIELSNEGEYQFRIARNTPIKFWIDDNLVFENKDGINFIFDSEILTVKLEKGIHRLLIKCATYPSDIVSNHLLSYKDNGNAYSSSDFDWSSYFGNMFSRGFSSSFGSSDKFVLRITDKNGEIINNINSSFDKNYVRKSYNPQLFTQYVSDYFLQKVKENPNDLYNYYLLCKAYIKTGKTLEAEEYFVNKYRDNKDVLLFKYLAAKIYGINDKSEKTYLVLNGYDEDKCPIYAMYKEELEKIDEESEKELYFQKLTQMKEKFPWNYFVIKSIAKYYSKNGMEDKKKEFVKKAIEEYPAYKFDLEPYLEDENYKPYEYKPETDSERRSEAKEAIKSIKTSFNVYDYNTAITHYKNLNKSSKALILYDELINVLPYSAENIYEKGKYLYQIDQNDQALIYLKRALKISPYNGEIVETIGDIYSDKKEKDSAIYFYEKSQLLESNGYSRNSIQRKIDKLREKDNIKDKFEKITFEEILEDKKWEEIYKKEESVVLLYTKDFHWGKDNKLSYYQKLMIKILTEEGARIWTEANFNYLGELNYVKVLKSNGAKITPDKQNGYVVFKDLEPGDVIQLEGTFFGYPYQELENELYLPNYLTFDAPVYASKVEFFIPENKNQNFYYHNLEENPIVNEVDGFTHYVWKYNNIPKYIQEDAVYDNADSYSFFIFSSFENWEPIVEWYLKKTYRKLDLTYEVKEIVDSIVSKEMSSEQKISALYNYITKEVNYSYVQFLQNNYIPKRPGLTCSGAIGDCKDVATLMLAMLKYLKIESYYCLVRTSTFMHKKILPTQAFDHVIVAYKIDDKMKYLDLTTNYYPYYTLNEMDTDSWGLLIKKGEKDVFKLPNDMIDSAKSSESIIVNAIINNDKSCTIEGEIISKGLIGGQLKEYLTTIPVEEQEKFMPTFYGDETFENVNIDKFEFENLKELEKDLSIKLNYSVTNFIDEVASMLIFRIPYFRSISTSPALQMNTRNTSLNLDNFQVIPPSKQIVNIEFPEGMKLTDLPKDVLYDNEFFIYKVKYTKTDKGLKVEKYQSFKQNYIEPKDFNSFKKLFLEIQALDRNKISIK